MNPPDKNKPQQPASSAPAAALNEIGSEPVARRAAVPALLFALLAALLFWGDTHILSQGGDFDSQVQYPFLSSNELASLSIREPEDPRITIGRRVFSFAGCIACHQPDGLGGVQQGCPPLAGSDWVLAPDPSRIIGIVLKGLTGPITVNGKEYATGTMVGLGASLSDEEVAGVLSFVRNNWSNKSPMVEASHVKKVRDNVKDVPGNVTVPELKKRFPVPGE